MQNTRFSITPSSVLQRAAAIVAVAALVAACGSSSRTTARGQPNCSSESHPTQLGTRGAASPSGGGSDSAAGGRAGATAGGSTSGAAAGSGVTIAFARCMRSHGVPAFPNPNRLAAALAPGGSVDPTSAPFQAALNGPCRSLAPQAWLSSGPGTANPGGGS
jgi:hypothetical protein